MSDTKTIIVSIPIMPHLCDSWRFEAPFGEFLSELEGVRLGIPLEFRETSRITISASGDYDGGHSIGDIEVTYSRPETEAERLERERSERERLLH